jgi:hypothetical protein
MTDEKSDVWEDVANQLYRIKVNGGHIYASSCEDNSPIAFVPDIDLTRYQAHLRDAYKKGYENGHADAKAGVHYDGDNRT